MAVSADRHTHQCCYTLQTLLLSFQQIWVAVSARPSYSSVLLCVIDPPIDLWVCHRPSYYLWVCHRPSYYLWVRHRPSYYLWVRHRPSYYLFSTTLTTLQRHATIFFFLQISRMRQYLTENAATKLVCSLILFRLDYANSLLFGLPNTPLDKLQMVQNSAARLILKRKRDHVTPLLKHLHWLPV